MSKCGVEWCRAEAYPGSEWCQYHEMVNPYDPGDVPRDCDPEEALMDHIMTAPIEVLAAEEGKTVEEALEEGRQTKERVLAMLDQRFPDFVKKVRS